MTDTNELRDKLAAIEHERWAGWQQYIHNCVLSGTFKKRITHWERQIHTSYAKLSDSEKASDMEQVDRYWPLIETYITAQTQAAYKQGYIDGGVEQLTTKGIL